MNEQIPLFATKKERKNIQEKDTNTANNNNNNNNDRLTAFDPGQPG